MAPRPPAPRRTAFRPAIVLAWRSADSTGSPANRRANAAAPKTSPQPVGSTASTCAPPMRAVRTADESALSTVFPSSRSNPGAATYAAPRGPRVTTTRSTPALSACADRESGSGKLPDLVLVELNQVEQPNQAGASTSGWSTRIPSCCIPRRDYEGRRRSGHESRGAAPARCLGRARSRK